MTKRDVYSSWIIAMAMLSGIVIGSLVPPAAERAPSVKADAAILQLALANRH
jgi:hypothetical protein